MVKNRRIAIWYSELKGSCQQLMMNSVISTVKTTKDDISHYWTSYGYHPALRMGFCAAHVSPWAACLLQITADHVLQGRRGGEGRRRLTKDHDLNAGALPQEVGQLSVCWVDHRHTVHLHQSDSKTHTCKDNVLDLYFKLCMEKKYIFAGKCKTSAYVTHKKCSSNHRALKLKKLHIYTELVKSPLLVFLYRHPG